MRSIRLAAALLLCAMPAWAADPRIAVFDMEFVNTSPAPDTPEELARVGALSGQLREALAKPGRYEVVDTAPVRDRVARGPSLRTCNTCAVDAGRTLGAELAAHAWVQKVSNLILNVNLSVEDVATGRQVYGGSVDIRGNTDESWRRGMRYLIEEQMFRDGTRPGSKP